MVETKVEEGKIVTVDYTGKLDDGTVFDTSEGKQPLQFQAGKGEVIKGFDDAVMGMSVGEEKTVEIPPAQGYGDTKEELVQSVPKSAFPGNVEVKEGMKLQLKNPAGQMMIATVLKIEAEQVKLDLNHPLAGKILHFTLKLVSVK